MEIRHEFVEFYTVFLKQDLQIPKVCRELHAKLLAAATNAQYFSSENIHFYAHLEEHADDPPQVALIKSYLKTFRDLELAVINIEGINIHPDQWTASILLDITQKLPSTLSLLYQITQQINHTLPLVQLLVEPLLMPFIKYYEMTRQTWDEHSPKTIAILKQHQTALKDLFSDQHQGLMLLSQTIVLIPELFSEFVRMLTERKFDQPLQTFDKAVLEKRMVFYRKQLNKILSPSWRAQFSGVWNLLTKLLEDTQKVITKLAPLVDQAEQFNAYLLTLIQSDFLPPLTLELELLESHWGLKENFFVAPIKESIKPWVIFLDQQVRSLQQTKEMLTRPMLNVGAQALNSLTAVFVDSTSHTPAPSDLVVFNKTYDLSLQTLRAQQLARLNHELLNPYPQIAAEHFFNRLETLNKEYVSTKSLAHLDEMTTADLAAAYFTIQHYVALHSPKLDQFIVNGLNVNAQEKAMLKNAKLWFFTFLYACFILNISGDLYQHRWQWFFLNTIILVMIVQAQKSYVNDFSKIINHKKDIFRLIHQEKTKITWVSHHLKKRDPQIETVPVVLNDLPNYQQQQQEFRDRAHAREPMRALVSQTKYQDLFTRIKNAKLSQSVHDFLHQDIYTWLKNNLDSFTAKEFFGTDQPDALPPFTQRPGILAQYGNPASPTAPEKTAQNTLSTALSYHQLINKINHLEQCLIQLEELDDYDVLSPWNIKQHNLLSIKFLIAILYDGLQAYLGLLMFAEDPLLKHVLKPLLDKVEIFSTIPFISSWVHAPKVTPPPVDALVAWGTQKRLVRSVLDQKPLTLVEPQAALEEALVFYGPLAPTKTYAERIATEIERLHAKYRDRQDDSKPAYEEINALVTKICIYLKSQLMKIYPQNEQTIDNLLENIKKITSFADVKSFGSSMIPHVSYDEITKRLEFIKKIKPLVCTEIESNLLNVLQYITQMQAIIGYECVSIASHIEFERGLKLGSLTRPLTETLDALSQALVKTLPADKIEEKLKLTTNHDLLNFQVQDACNRYNTIQKQARSLKDQHAKLKKLYTKLSESQSFTDESIACYTQLQPYLIKINARYHPVLFSRRAETPQYEKEEILTIAGMKKQFDELLETERRDNQTNQARAFQCFNTLSLQLNTLQKVHDKKIKRQFEIEKIITEMSYFKNLHLSLSSYAPLFKHLVTYKVLQQEDLFNRTLEEQRIHTATEQIIAAHQEYWNILSTLSNTYAEMNTTLSQPIRPNSNNPCVEAKRKYMEKLKQSSDKPVLLTSLDQALINEGLTKKYFSHFKMETNFLLRKIIPLRNRALKAYDQLINLYDRLDALEHYYDQTQKQEKKIKLQEIKTHFTRLFQIKDQPLNDRFERLVDMMLQAYDDILFTQPSHSFFSTHTQETTYIQNIYHAMGDLGVIYHLLKELKKSVIKDGSDPDKLKKIERLQSFLMNQNQSHEQRLITFNAYTVDLKTWSSTSQQLTTSIQKIIEHMKPWDKKIEKRAFGLYPAEERIKDLKKIISHMSDTSAETRDLQEYADATPTETEEAHLKALIERVILWAPGLADDREKSEKMLRGDVNKVSSDQCLKKIQKLLEESFVGNENAEDAEATRELITFSKMTPEWHLTKLTEQIFTAIDHSSYDSGEDDKLQDELYTGMGEIGAVYQVLNTLESYLYKSWFLDTTLSKSRQIEAVKNLLKEESGKTITEKLSEIAEKVQSEDWKSTFEPESDDYLTQILQKLVDYLWPQEKKLISTLIQKITIFQSVPENDGLERGEHHNNM